VSVTTARFASQERESMATKRSASTHLLAGAAMAIACLAMAPAKASGLQIDLHANSKVTAADVGLPAYPGASPYKEKDKDDDSADLGLILGAFHFRLKVATFIVTDTPGHLLDFYRKPLAHYGDVLECDHGKPVGSVTTTHSGLTCSDSKGDSINSDEHQLRAGTPHQFRIVTVQKADQDSAQNSTRFSLVYVELPKDNEKSQ
jgi:hypothetical protein